MKPAVVKKNTISFLGCAHFIAVFWHEKSNWSPCKLAKVYSNESLEGKAAVMDRHLQAN